MHVLLKIIRNLNIHIDLQLHLFDHMMSLIALYGGEIWGFENSQFVENLHNDFLRHILGLTPVNKYMIWHVVEM